MFLQKCISKKVLKCRFFTVQTIHDIENVI